MSLEAFLAGEPLQLHPALRVKFNGRVVDAGAAKKVIGDLEKLRPLDVVATKNDGDEQVLMFRHRGDIAAVRFRFADGKLTALVARL